MEFLTTEEAKNWCQARALKVTAERYLQCERPSLHCFTIGLEEKPSRVIALADFLVPTWGDIAFNGALLWIRARGVWGDYSEQTAARIVEQMRLANGESEPIEKSPGHLFGPDELFEMHSYFVVPILFGWDAFLVPENGGYFVFVSHDGVAEVVAQTADRAEELRKRLDDWKPQEDKNWYPKIAR